jgi:hypothetical protein
MMRSRRLAATPSSDGMSDIGSSTSSPPKTSW